MLKELQAGGLSGAKLRLLQDAYSGEGIPRPPDMFQVKRVIRGGRAWRTYLRYVGVWEFVYEPCIRPRHWSTGS